MKYNVEVDILAGTSHSLMLQQIKPNSKVLEFGSASGYMTQYMKEKLECRVVCIEIDIEAAEKARGFAEVMINADIEKLNWAEEIYGQSFDYILFADVLEHLRNPDAVLSKAMEYLDDNGVVMTSIPNISHNAIIMELMEGRFDYQSIGLLDDTHVHFFTKKSILRMLDQAGLEPCAWYTTMRKPESTEFYQNYSNFPISVQNYLKSRNDAEVYQFVTFSKKKNFPDETNQFLESQYPNYLDQDYCQIYWGEGLEFNEESSKQKPLVLSGEKKIYKIEIPHGSSGNLRFDPSNTPVYGEITRVDLFIVDDKGNKTNMNLNPKNDFDFLKSSNGITRLTGLNKFRFVAYDNDSNLVMENIEIEASQKYLIEIEMLVTNSVERIIKETIEDFNNIRATIHAQLNDKEIIISEAQNKYEQLESKLQKIISESEQIIKESAQIKEDFEHIKIEYDQMKIEYDSLRQKKDEQEIEIESRQQLLEATVKELNLIVRSLSWRSTAIFRFIANKFRRK